ncbi:homoserine/threonine efflux transporter [Pasteurella multocida]|uniref:homoserine/threonine efflux transporter n=1 Tax=Pasteurella multocida TaxID=747 RepID=UPI002A57E6B6|nr:homoserine/threonine efflux transporter [Pasteurella multocida]MDY0428010.1 homoserine/threonine efflux transporter [Pasteurella multocida]MDY0430077.1 homoserine/threonine efflux transporter [Pasteurella multocida]MDY0449748.1 homoserine/threonine efflux transporter [Pasteurella multocida]MDY0528023.1 homoserine/threonine efflux transporter [Pasteurella multocida]MDY0573069.1 homoserine/threonine efflux transporter [Pasteurella multocida]
MLNLIIVHFFGLITPGPDFFYVSRLAASNSRRNALCAVIGITLGVLFWALASILGLAILFNTVPVLQGLVMTLGGGYLAYLGYLMLKSQQNVVFEPVSEQEQNKQTSIKKEITKGLLVNLSNAKAVIYFASVMSLVLVNLTQTWQIWSALLIIVLETFLHFYAISIVFSRQQAKQFYSQYSRYIDHLSGVIFLLFGVYLMYSGIGEMTPLISK